MTADNHPAARPSALRAVEARSIDFVPDDERHGTVFGQTRFWFIGNFVFITTSIGFLGPSLGLSIGWSILAGALGNVIGGLFMALHASQGPKLGLPQMIQTRAQLGYKGVVVALFATLFVFLGFNVLSTLLLMSGINQLFGIPPAVVAIVAAILAATLAIYGYDWLHKLFTIVFYVSIPLFAVLVLFIVLGKVGGATTPHTGGFILTAFMTQLVAMASYNIAFAPYVSDFSRYLPRSTPTGKVIAAVLGGACGSGFVMVALGAWLASAMNETDALVGIYDAGNGALAHFGVILAVVSVIALNSAMGMNAYSAHLTVLTAIAGFRGIASNRANRIRTILALAVIWCTISISLGGDFLTSLNNALVLMLYLLIPWSALNLMDFFVVRRSHYAILDVFKIDGIYGVWAWRGLTAYAAGFVSMLPFVVTSFYVGPVAQAINGIDVAWIVGLIVSGGVYLALSRSINLTAEATAIRASEEDMAASGLENT